MVNSIIKKDDYKKIISLTHLLLDYRYNKGIDYLFNKLTENKELKSYKFTVNHLSKNKNTQLLAEYLEKLWLILQHFFIYQDINIVLDETTQKKNRYSRKRAKRA